jgi:hypothetical protein
MPADLSPDVGLLAVARLDRFVELAFVEVREGA